MTNGISSTEWMQVNREIEDKISDQKAAIAVLRTDLNNLKEQLPENYIRKTWFYKNWLAVAMALVALLGGFLGWLSTDLLPGILQFIASSRSE